MVTTRTAVAISVVVTVILSAIVGTALYYTFPSAAKQTTVTVTAAALPAEITIGALLPLTGDLASQGQNNRLALQLFQDDINSYLQSLGLNTRVNIVIEDTGTKPTQALEKLQALAARGIKLFLGPDTSAEIRQLKTFADSNRLLIISPSSTAPDLAIPNDYVFRTVTDDRFQGRAIATMLHDYGITCVVAVYRNDVWGKGLFNATTSHFNRLGMRLIDSIAYPSENPDMSAVASTLNDRVTSAINQCGVDKTAVLGISFTEAGTLLATAGGYENLMKVVWFGSDGTAQEDPVAQTGGQQGAKVKLYSTIIAPALSPKYEDFVNRFKQRFGVNPTSYSATLYDAALLLVTAILQTGSTDPVVLQKVLIQASKSVFGVTGWLELNDAGDRAFANYNIYKIVSTAQGYGWALAGFYDAATDSVTWISK